MHMIHKNPYRVTIVAYPGMTMLDAIGPNEVLGNSPFFEVKWVSTEREVLENDQKNLCLHNLEYFESVSRTDILLIPGGAGDHYAMQRDDLIRWINEIDKNTILTTSVCTGALILGQAGLLKGIKACTHWACLDELAKLGAKPTRTRFIQDGKIVTASGVSAGIDMALYLLKTLVSKKHATDIRFAIEYFPNQFHLINSYSLPKRLLSKLSLRFKEVFTPARDKIILKKRDQQT